MTIHTNLIENKIPLLWKFFMPRKRNYQWQVNACLDARHKMEEKIHEKLESIGLGEWIADDLGPGGANMLSKVTEWEKSIQLILDILNQENLLYKGLLVKRWITSEDDWNYEIIYPIDYEMSI